MGRIMRNLRRHFTKQEWTHIQHLIRSALKEDIGTGDITTRALIPRARVANAKVIAREEGIVAGLGVSEAVFKQLDQTLRVSQRIKDGTKVSRGLVVMKINGGAASILSAERVALNFLSRLSGIATLTAQFVERIRPLPVQVLDTRKTTPGWRLLEKYAVRIGGGISHRMGLYDQALVKDNHLALLRDENVQTSSSSAGLRDQFWSEIISRLRSQLVKNMAIEVEIQRLIDLPSTLQAQPDWILLDNFVPKELRQAVVLRNQLQPKVFLEASGGITLGNVRQYAQTGVDAISAGALTHSAKGINFSMEIVQAK